MIAEVQLRTPEATDGAALYHLVSRCPPLDANSRYCNLLQCTHFADTSVAAVRGGELVGFVTAYLLPHDPKTLFVWQVAVDEAGRGRGLARRMLLDILQRPVCRGATHLETSITSDNEASWRTFRGFAQSFGAALERGPWLSSHVHFEGRHPSELLVRIGPFDATAAEARTPETKKPARWRPRIETEETT